MLKFNVIILTIVVNTFAATAGWKIVEQITDSKTTVSTVQTIYIQDDKIKIERPAETLIINLNTQSISIIFHADRTYWTGNLQEFKVGALLSLQSQFDLIAALVPADEQEYYKKYFENLMSAYRNPKRKKIRDEKQISISKTDELCEILGYECSKYELFAGDTLIKQFWLTKKLNTKADFNKLKFNEFMTQLLPHDNNYYENRAYLKLYKKGEILKTIDYKPQHTIMRETVSIEQQDFSLFFFSPPHDYFLVSLNKIIPRIIFQNQEEKQ